MLSGLIARIRSLWAGITGGHSIDDEMQQEFRAHMELRAADLLRAGLSPEEAGRRARVEFGGMHNYKEVGREARGLRGFDALRFSWLDIKLGARMLARYPALTLVGGAAMGVAIAIGAGVLGLVALLQDPRIPLDEGDRIVGIQVWSVRSNNAERRILHDFTIWREKLRTVEDLGLFRSHMRNLVSPDGRAEPAHGAAMSASGFRVARVPPLLGRYLVDEDERESAPPVVVLGHDLWRARFGSDSAIVGARIPLGGVAHTVVGVMPHGFRFPVNHQLWVPLRLNPLLIKPRQGPVLYAFGRLAATVTLEEARAEVDAVGSQIAQANPRTHESLRPRLLPFAQSWFELDSPETTLMYRAGQVAVTLLLVIICVNIAILVYARTAMRQGEIAVRSALGASRFRVVAQLFGEALVFAGIGAAFGLAIIAFIGAQAGTILAQTPVADVLPFWVEVGVSGATVGYLVALTVLAAAIIGVLPALQVTGRRVQANLQRWSGGHSTIRMGRLWTSLIIAEVALTVAILPTAVFFGAEAVRTMTTHPGFAAEQYLSGVLSLDREVRDTAPTPAQNRAFAQRFARGREELMRRLTDERGVRAVTFARYVPGEEQSTRIELDGNDAARVRWAVVDPAFFDGFEVPVVAGRTFGPVDADTMSTAAIVNRTFVATLLRGRNALGQRFRMLEMNNEGEEVRGPWQEIVGVVEDFPALVDYERPKAVWYTAARSGLQQPIVLAVRMQGGDPSTFAAGLRAIAARVEPGFQVRNVKSMDDVIREAHLPLRLAASGLMVVALSVLLLSAAGLYSLMSVIVTQRRREIGIRIALGADRRRVLSSIFSRAAVQLGMGVSIGIVMAVLVAWAGAGEMQGFDGWIIMSAVAVLMMVVGVLAALGPARRGLAIQPITVLKED